VGASGEGARLEETAGAVAAVLRKIGHPAAVIGGIAVIAHGHARATSDVDCAIAASLSESAPIYDAFLSAGFEPRSENALEFAQQSLVLTLRYKRTGVPVEHQLREFDELLDTDQAGEWRRLLGSLKK
jgi:hypothetical protein